MEQGYKFAVETTLPNGRKTVGSGRCATREHAQAVVDRLTEERFFEDQTYRVVAVRP